MLSLGTSLLLLLPVMLVISLVGAAPGRPVLRDAFRTGLRQFVVSTLSLVLGALAFSLLAQFLLGRPPLF
jgi:hypothetical protein